MEGGCFMERFCGVIEESDHNDSISVHQCDDYARLLGDNGEPRRIDSLGNF